MTILFGESQWLFASRHLTQIYNRYKQMLLLQNFNAFPELLRISSEVRLRCTSVTKIGQVSQG